MFSNKCNPARSASGRPDQSASGFEFLDHPADLKLRAWGVNLQELFAHAAEGMMAHLFGKGIATFQPSPREMIEIEAPDREALLVEWLSELLYRVTSEYHAYVGFDIHELGETGLKASARPVAAEAIEDIKAVTHHELSIRRCQDGWEATVVFDI